MDNKNLIIYTELKILQMNKVQAEQSQRLLQQFQQKMEEEMLMRQNMMHNQFQMMTQLQSDFPTFSASTIFDLKNQKENKNEEAENELKVAMKEKISDIESIFKIKEEKIIENYEYVIKDLENKLDIEQGKFRDAAEIFKDEKERLVQNQRAIVERIHEDNRSMSDTMKLEYMKVIENLKSLRKVETDSKDEINETTRKINRLSLEVEKQSQQNLEERLTEEAEQAKSLNKREEELEKKDRELQRLQEIILHRQESSDNERKKLTEAILKLESKLNKKEMELESEKRQSLFEKEQLEYQIKKFEQEKEVFLSNLKIEKNKMYEERKGEREDIDRLRREHSNQIKQLKLEKAKYAIHKRLKHSQVNDHDFDKTMESDAVEHQLKVLEQERGTIKKSKQKLKSEQKRLAEGQRKLQKQRQDISVAIEKLYEVERGINDKFSQLDKIKDQVLNLKKTGVEACGEFKKLNNGVDDFLGVVEEALVNLLRQEQKVKSETLTLNGERKKINMTRSSVLCSACSRPVMKSLSSRDLRNIDSCGWEDRINTKRIPPIAWMDLQEHQLGKVSSRVLGSRTSCDGASLEAIDTHVSALKKDAENDKKYLKDEVDYLKTLQKINVKTLAKYQ